MAIDAKTEAENANEKPRILAVFIETINGELINLRYLQRFTREDLVYQHSRLPYYRLIANQSEENDSTNYKNMIWDFETPEQRDFFYNDIKRKIKSLPTIMVI